MSLFLINSLVVYVDKPIYALYWWTRYYNHDNMKVIFWVNKITKAVNGYPRSGYPLIKTGTNSQITRISGSTNMYSGFNKKIFKKHFLQQFRTLFFHKRRWIHCCAHDCVDDLINAGQSPQRSPAVLNQPSCIHLHLIIKVRLQCSTKRRRRQGCQC